MKISGGKPADQLRRRQLCIPKEVKFKVSHPTEMSPRTVHR